MARDIPLPERKRRSSHAKHQESRGPVRVEEYSPAIRRNDRETIEFDYGRVACNFLCLK